MAATIMQVARTLGRESGWALSNLDLEKIAYIAEMLHLGRTGAPLIREDWQAWAYGPVQPDLYHKLKVFGNEPVSDIFHTTPIAPGSQYKAIIDAYQVMRNFNPGEMVGVTHRRGGAWAKTYSPNARSRIIPKSDICQEYSTLFIEDDD